MNEKLLTYSELEFLKQIDKMILESSPELFEKIQKIDKENQLSGESFCEIWVNYLGKNLESSGLQKKHT